MRNTSKLKAVQLGNEQRELAMNLVDAAISPQQKKAVRQTVVTEVDRMTALTNKKAYAQVDPATGETRYFLDRSVEVPAAAIPGVSDPQKLYEVLVGFQIPPGMAEKIVETKLGAPQFEPGKLDYSKADMKTMPFAQLRGVAVQLGYRPTGKATRNKLMKYVASRIKK